MRADEIASLMKNYRAYRYAVQQYESHHPSPAAGVANYDAMPGGSGAPELFFSIVGKPADMGYTSAEDLTDYQAYKSAVEAIDGAMSVLTDDEQSVMRLKWMEDIDLRYVAERKHMALITIRRIHKRAITRMATALRFYRMPDIDSDHMDVCSPSRIPGMQRHNFEKPTPHGQI